MGLQHASSGDQSSDACVAACCDQGASCTLWQWCGSATDCPQAGLGIGCWTGASDASCVANGDKWQGGACPAPPKPGVHVWAPTSQTLSWEAWHDTVIPADAKGLPPATAHYTKWVGSALGRVVRAAAPMEAVNFTEYDSELCMYAAAVSAADVHTAAGADPSSVQLSLASTKTQAWTVFANGELVGSSFEGTHSHGAVTANVVLDLSKTPTSSPVLLALLSTSLGIDNFGAGVHNSGSSFRSDGVKGIISSGKGSVVLGGVDITQVGWTHVVGAAG